MLKAILTQRISEVLFFLWDPIGVKWASCVRDEYDSYVPEIVALLSAGAEAKEIRQHLDDIVVYSMGLVPDYANHKAIAALLLDIYDVVNSMK